MKLESIICYGEVLWDMLPDGAKPGGALLNVAIHLQKHGHSAHLISKTGYDAEGEKLLQFLNESGIDTRFIQKDHTLPTSKVLVHLDKNKNATYEICQPVAWDNIRLTSELEVVAQKADLIIFGSLATRNAVSLKTLLKLLKITSAVKLMDVNLRPPFDQQEHVEKLLHHSDFVKLNDEELDTIAGWNGISGTQNEMIKWFAKFFMCPTICVTRGEKGAVLYYEEKFFEHPGFKVKAKDTVGAGDSFLAALIAKLFTKHPPEKALEYACATGAFVASQAGAVPAYTKDDILQIQNNK